MLGEKEIYSVTSKSWVHPAPILNFDEVTQSIDCSYLLLEITSGQKVSHGFVCSLPAENIFSGQIQCHEHIVFGRSQKVYKDFSRSRIQRNPVLLITDVEPFWNCYAAKRRSFKCVKSFTQVNGFSYKLFELPHEMDEIDSLDSLLCLADGHHRFHAFQKLYESTHDLSEVSLSCAIFHVSDVTTSRKGVILDRNCSIDALVQYLSDFFSFVETDRSAQSHAIKIRIKNKWHEMIFASSEEENVFPHVALKRILENSNEFKALAFSLFPEKNDESLETEIEKQSNIGIIFPSDDPSSVLEFSLSGGLFDANSTFFQPKFPNNLVTHVLEK